MSQERERRPGGNGAASHLGTTIQVDPMPWTPVRGLRLRGAAARRLPPLGFFESRTPVLPPKAATSTQLSFGPL